MTPVFAVDVFNRRFIKDPRDFAGEKSGTVLPAGEQNQCRFGIRNGKKNPSRPVMLMFV